MVNNKEPTHIFCDKYECIKKLLPHTVAYEFDDSLTIDELIKARQEFIGNPYKELHINKPTTLNGYKVYQGSLQ